MLKAIVIGAMFVVRVANPECFAHELEQEAIRNACVVEAHAEVVRYDCGSDIIMKLTFEDGTKEMYLFD